MIPEDMKRPKAGGRPSNHSLLLTEPEFLWLCSTLNKRQVMLAKVKGGSQKTRAAIDSIADKLVIPVPSKKDSFVVKLSRDELQVVNSIISNTVAAFNTTVLPEYEKRAADSPRHTEARNTVAMLTELLNKGTKVYEAGSHRRGNSRVPKS